MVKKVWEEHQPGMKNQQEIRPHASPALEP